MMNIEHSHKQALPQKVIEAKISDFFNRYYKTITIKKLPAQWRMVVSFVLWYHFGYTAAEIAKYLGDHKATVYRDLQRGQFYIARSMTSNRQAKRLVEYIYKFL